MKKCMSKPKVTQRRFLGLNITGASKVNAPIVYAIYEETSLEKTPKGWIVSTKASRGESLQTMQHSGMLNGSKKERAYHLKAFHPELYYSIQAAAVLYQQLEQACLALDADRGLGEFRK